MIDSNVNVGKKQVVLNMVANIVSYSANIIISFILTPYLINTLGAETYSFYPMANTIVSYMSVLSNAMNSMSSRFVTVALVKGEKEDANKYYTSVFVANILMAIVLSVPMLLMVIGVDLVMDVPINSVAAIRCLFALVFSSALINILASVFGIATFAKNRIDLRSLRELITAVLRLVLFYVMYMFLPPSIVYVGVVTLVVAVVNIIFQKQYTKMLLPEICISRKYISKSHTLELLGSCVWNAINNFGNTLLAGMTMILANMFYGAEASGEYSIVQTVPQFICGVITMLVGVFYPVITYKYAQEDKEGLILETQTAQKLVGVFGCSVIVVFSALAEEFFALWTPGQNASHLSQLSFVTILPHVLIACLWPLTNLNVVMNKIKIPALFTLGMGVANVLIAYTVYRLVQPGVIYLPVISTVLQYIWIGVFIPLYTCYNLKIKAWTFYPMVFKTIMTSAGIFMCIWKIKELLLLNNWLKFILVGGGFGIATILIMTFVIIGPKQVIIMIRKIIKKN